VRYDLWEETFSMDTRVDDVISAPAPASDSRAGASIAVAWKDAGSSKPFKVEELRDEQAR
jgi:hypothetical protein